MAAYVSELILSRKCKADEREVVCFGDSGQKGTDIYWCDTIGRWVCVTLEPEPRLATAKEIALVRMHEDADPKELEQRALACDFEREQALWIISAAILEDLAAAYGDALKVLWSSERTGKAPFPDAAFPRQQTRVAKRPT